MFILPEALMRMASPWKSLASWHMYVNCAVMVGTFYLNYYIIIPRTLTGARGRRWWLFVGLNLLLVVGAALLMYYLNTLGGHPRRHRNRDEWQIILATASFIMRDVVMLVLVVSLALMLRLSAKWTELERRQRELISARRESELSNLRSQLNPHFLFNTLNSIYSLIAISPPEAQKAVHDLSALLRYVVYENPERVPLQSEVNFVANYVELMRLRMGARPVEFTTDISGSPQIAPLLFVTLVENAFKHGNTSDPSLPIRIHIKADGELIACSTFNHSDSAAVKDAAGGVGLANLKRRLELLYGDEARLDMQLPADGECCVTLIIPSK